MLKIKQKKYLFGVTCSKKKKKKKGYVGRDDFCFNIISFFLSLFLLYTKSIWNTEAKSSHILRSTHELSK